MGPPEAAQVVEDRLRQRHQAFLVALADDAQQPMSAVDGADLQRGGLADAQAAGIHDNEARLVVGFLTQPRSARTWASDRTSGRRRCLAGLHPATSRVNMLSEQHPVTFVVFDLLLDRNGNALLARPLRRRRQMLVDFMTDAGESSGLQLSPATTSRDQALTWLELVGRGLNGIVAKRLDQAYQPGRRAMQKYKLWHTVDCVVGGVYLDPRGKQGQSVLLGLYDDDGKLHYVGRSTLHANATAITEKLMPFIGGEGEGFSGRSPGGRNRWSGRERKVVPLQPELVVEASADHITDRHFRHGARILRWRTDKEPRDCTMDQIA